MSVFKLIEIVVKIGVFGAYFLKLFTKQVQKFGNFWQSWLQNTKHKCTNPKQSSNFVQVDHETGRFRSI